LATRPGAALMRLLADENIPWNPFVPCATLGTLIVLT
jgi:hypothetical protein